MSLSFNRMLPAHGTPCKPFLCVRVAGTECHTGIIVTINGRGGFKRLFIGEPPRTKRGAGCTPKPKGKEYHPMIMYPAEGETWSHHQITRSAWRSCGQCCTRPFTTTPPRGVPCTPTWSDYARSMITKRLRSPLLSIRPASSSKRGEKGGLRGKETQRRSRNASPHQDILLADQEAGRGSGCRLKRQGVGYSKNPLPAVPGGRFGS